MIHEYSELVESIPSSGIRKFFDLVIGSKDVISLGVGEPDFSTPWTIREVGIQTLEAGNTTYTSNRGILECRQAVSDYLDKRFGRSFCPETEIILTAGVSPAVDIVLRTILNPGDEVLLPEPTYVCYKPLIQLTGSRCVAVNTTESNFIPTLDSVKSAITPKTKAIILCTPSNPTGMSIPKSFMEGLAKLAKEHDFWIISDEVYAELSYDDQFSSILDIPGIEERTILLSGFSKGFAMTGWRLGYVCGPEPLISRALKIHQYSALCAPIFSQYAGIEALTNASKDVEHMRLSFKDRREICIRKFNEIGLTTPTPNGAFYCFSSIKSTGMNSEEFAIELLKKKNVAVIPGRVFGENCDHFIRTCYATREDLLITALERIGDFVSENP